MKEADWLACATRPMAMLQHARKKASPRKLRLLACACCRQVWDHLTDDRGRAGVTALERFLEGVGDEAALGEARAGVQELYGETAYLFDRAAGEPYSAHLAAVCTAAGAMSDDPSSGVAQCFRWLYEYGIYDTTPLRVRALMCDLIREVVGNPFRPWAAVPDFLGGGVIQPDGATVRLTGTARELAAGIAADQAFDRLPVLADALEEAGVTDPELLTHCRTDTGTGHVRGCWAVDVVLGRS